MLVAVSALIAIRVLMTMIMAMVMVMSMVMVIGMRNGGIESMGETRPLHRFFVFLFGIGFSPAFTLQMKIRRRQQLA